MTRMRCWRAALLILGLILGVVVTGAGAQNFGVRPEERFFNLTWSPERGPGDTAKIVGHISSGYGEFAVGVVLLVEGLDEGGAVVGKTIGYVDRPIPPGGSAYFEVPVTPTGREKSYRVSVLYHSRLRGGM